MDKTRNIFIKIVKDVLYYIDAGCHFFSVLRPPRPSHKARCAVTKIMVLSQSGSDSYDILPDRVHAHILVYIIEEETGKRECAD